MDITVKQKDAVNLTIECEKSIAKELSQYFTFYVPNYQYTPAYKKKYGTVKFVCLMSMVEHYMSVYWSILRNLH